VRNFVCFVFRILYRTLFRVEIIGWDNVPAKGPYIVAFNHVSLFDPPFVVSFWPVRPEVLGAAYLWKKPGIGQLMRLYSVIPINREDVDRGAIRRALSALTAGGVLVLAPEGTRSHKPGLLPAKTGVAYLAHKSNAPVIPVGIVGTTPDALKNTGVFHRPKLTMRIGQPIAFQNPESEKHMSTFLKQNTDVIMTRLAQLLPENYRGHYANRVQRST